MSVEGYKFLVEGHKFMGLSLFVIGLWHLFNNIKLHSLSSKPYSSTLWFPTRISKYLELHLVMAICTIFASTELFLLPLPHNPFEPDGTIPSNHFNNFEHSSMVISFVVFATFALVLDKKCIKTQNELTHLLLAIAFLQEFLLFHLHSRDHTGPEGQLHYFLQILILICLVTSLMGICFPKSFMVSFVRSVSILFQGLWVMFTGFVIFTPGFASKGCYLQFENDQYLVRCSDDKALHRAISMVNIQFSWFLIGVTIFAMSFYLILNKRYSGKVEYVSLMMDEYLREEDDPKANDVELQCQKTSKQEPI